MGVVSCWASMIKVSSGRVREPDGEFRAWMTWRFVRGLAWAGRGIIFQIPSPFRNPFQEPTEADLEGRWAPSSFSPCWQRPVLALQPGEGVL